MNSWAKSSNYDCNFLCICVLGDRNAVSLAKEMGKESGLTHCVNGFIDNQAGMPQYGQLGCQGFIVLDSQHRVVSSATSPFMQVRDIAFKHVEALIAALCAGRAPPRVCPGEFVELIEAPSEYPKLLGQQAICIAQKEDLVNLAFVSGSMRGKQIQVPTSKVRKLDGEDDDDDMNGTGGECGTGGCGQGSGCSQDPFAKSQCNQGNCGTPDCASNGDCSSNGVRKIEKIERSFVDAALDLVSVQVPSMDEEHEECADALRRLAAEQSVNALEAVIQCLSEHFAHEEALFEKYGFGGSGDDRFSAKKSHTDDHRRICGNMQKMVSATKTGLVPAQFIKEVLQDFHEHTSRYDKMYAEFMSSKGAQ
mmetsp:Transcript_118619/g.186148  ORF Transcript_118619/g.186148 Transcript_118619/m.186148 type:complete len:364 (-) Transcript_118619:106-1197(-)